MFRSRFACLPIYHPSRPAAPPCVSCLCSLFAISSHPLILPALATPVASPCSPSPFLVSPGGAFCVSLSSRHAFRLPSCALLVALRSAHPRGAIEDALASFLRSVDTVPPLPRLARAVGCLSWHACVIMDIVAMGPSDRGIRASVSYATPPYKRASWSFLFFVHHDALAFAISAVPLFLSPCSSCR